MRNRGFNKHKLSLWFSEIKYSLRAKYLGANPGNICYFQGTRETQAETLLINMAEGIMKEATSGVPDDPTEVVSEDEGVTSLEEIVCLEGAISKGIAKRSNSYSISVSNKNKKYPLYVQLLSLPKNRKEKEYAASFQDLYWNTKNRLIEYSQKKLLHYWTQKV